MNPKVKHFIFVVLLLNYISFVCWFLLLAKVLIHLFWISSSSIHCLFVLIHSVIDTRIKKFKHENSIIINLCFGSFSCFSRFEFNFYYHYTFLSLEINIRTWENFQEKSKPSHLSYPTLDSKKTYNADFHTYWQPLSSVKFNKT